MTELPNSWRMTLTIVGKELLDLARDRRAVFFAFILPLFLYPIMFFVVAILPRAQKADLSEMSLSTGTSGAPARLAEFLLDQGLDPSESEYTEEKLRDGSLKLFLDFDQRIESDDDASQVDPDSSYGSNYIVRMHFYATDPESSEARRRAVVALNRYREHVIGERFAARDVVLVPSELVNTESRNVSSADEQQSAKLGRILPVFMIMLLLTGGSFAAIDLLAGEKERGTLETLYLHPVATSSIIAGKFSVIFAVSIVSLVLNYLGMVLGVWLCQWIDVASDVGSLAIPLYLPPASTVGLIALLLLPLAAFTSAILLSLSAYSQSFREAQTYLLPATLVCLVGVLLGLAPQLKLASVVAVIPIANVTLGIREALLGTLKPLPYLVTLASSMLYAWVALRRAALMLHNEGIVLGFRRSPQLDEINSEQRARRVLIFAGFMLLAVYFAQVLTKDSLFVGLAILLWVVVLLPSLAYPFVFKLPLRETFGFHRAPVRAYLIAVAMVPFMAVLNLGYMQLQNLFLPMPTFDSPFLDAVTSASPWLVFLLFAVSPGVCEEMLWRGVFQGELEQRKRPVRTVLLVGLMFGVFHLNIYRIIPTAMAGVLMATLRYRTGSIFPAMVFHCLYNASLIGLAISSTENQIKEDTLRFFVSQPAVWITTLVVLALLARGLTRSPAKSDRALTNV